MAPGCRSIPAYPRRVIPSGAAALFGAAESRDLKPCRGQALAATRPFDSGAPKSGAPPLRVTYAAEGKAGTDDSWEDGVMTDLGTVGGGSSYGRGINDRGQIVGWSDPAGGPHRATLWTVSAPAPTPEQSIANLVAELEALVAEGRLEARGAQGLRAKLEAA